MTSHRLLAAGRLILSATVLMLAGLSTYSIADEYVSPAQSRLRADVTYLADDAREGRGPGTKGLDDSADYIAHVFREAGLKPAPGADGYFQSFTIRGEYRVADGVALSISLPSDKRIKAESKVEFTPLNLGGSGSFEGVPLIFAGYGISAKDENRKLDYDDYGQVDVKDKVVLIIRKEPQQDKEDSPFNGKENSSYATFLYKASNAQKHGAKAVLIVNDGASLKDGAKDELLDFQAVGGGGVQIPFVMITRALGDKILAAAGQPSLFDLEAGIDTDLQPRSRALDGVAVDANVSIERKPISVKNVIGVLEGSGPSSDETIVIGAHYDHLGFGGMGSLLPGNRSIHNGADDNASGTALIMELARRMARRPDPLPRRIVFMAFSAEERGLLGSEHYVNHPLYPIENTVAMVNFDMVGRLDREKRNLTVFGAGTSEKLDTLVDVLSSSLGLKARNVMGTQGEFFASDHASFYKKNIPVLFFFTGTHADYHRPSDDTPLINFEGMSRIADLGELVLLDLVRRPDRPRFVRLNRNGPVTASTTSTPGNDAAATSSTPTAPTSPNTAPTSDVGATRTSSGAYLGTRPSYGESQEGNGVKLEGVTEGSPAEKGGLKAGDLIIKFGDKDVKDVETYMTALGSYRPGDTVPVIVKRDGKDVPLKVTLGTRPNRAAQN